MAHHHSSILFAVDYDILHTLHAISNKIPCVVWPKKTGRVQMEVNIESRHTVVCRTAQENGARANGVSILTGTMCQSRDFHASVAP